jgi:cytochrome c oxidase assembly factor CtaG
VAAFFYVVAFVAVSSKKNLPFQKVKCFVGLGLIAVVCATWSERPISTADSTGQCNTFAEHLSGRLEAERFARPLV